MPIDYTKLVNLEDAKVGMNTEHAMIASNYSSASTYAVGAYAYYAGTLYKCTTAITTAEAWNSAHWAEAKLGNDLVSQSEKIEEVTNTIGTDNIVILSQANTYFPYYVKKNDKIVISTADGSLMEDNLCINFYTKSRTFITGIWLLVNTRSKTTTYTSDSEAYYASITSHPLDIVISGGRDQKYPIITNTLLTEDVIPDTAQVPYFNSSGQITSILHKRSNNDVVRTDAFTYAENTITEVRTLETGETLTIAFNKTTKVTEVY